MTSDNAGGYAVLRAATDDLHEQIEARTQVPDSLCTADDLVGFLSRWVALAERLEPRAAPLVPSSLLPVLRADLRRLGAEPSPATTSTSTSTSASTSTEAGGELGTAWVLLGARLGLKSVAPVVRSLTDQTLETFTSVDARALVDLRHRIDDLDEADQKIVVDQAVDAFTVAGDILNGPPWS